MTKFVDPMPGTGEVRINVRCCAVCRTDLHIIEGDLPAARMPVIPGHQIIGIVDVVGPGCRRLKKGNRIGLAWLRYTDGTCRFCTSGRENLCEASRYTSYNVDGGYATTAIAPEDFTYDIPDSYDDVSAAPLLCAGLIGYHSLQRSRVRPGQKLALFGFGSSAHLVIQLARARGCQVYVVSRAPAHQALAMDLGAAWAGSDAGGMPAKADAAIVFAPSGPIVPQALRCLDRGGAVALAGIHMSPIPALDYDGDLFYERDLLPVTANTRQEGRDFLIEAAAANVRARTKVYPLQEANRALSEMKHDQIDGTGVLVMEG